jgi:putative transposase
MIDIRKSFKYRIYPTKKQAKLLEDQFEKCRWLYNHFLEERKIAWEKEKKPLSYFSQSSSVASLKSAHPELKEVHSQVLQEVASRIDLAFKAFFRRVKAGQNPGYPRFKWKGRYDSITFPQVPSGCSIENGRLYVSKVGHIKIVLHRKLKGTPKTATIQGTATGKWYVSFSCEVGPKRLKPNKKAVGIDVGLHSFATLSTGEAIENPKFFRKEEARLRRVQRRLSETERATKRYKFRKKIVARIHERITFKRDNFTHQHSWKTVKNFGIISVEDLEVNRMNHNHCLAKSIADAAWSAFFRMLSYKAAEAGRTFIRVNPAYTTQDCSGCGHRQPIPLSDRIYKCPCCKLEIGRDLNASKNILRLGLQSLAGLPA